SPGRVIAENFARSRAASGGLDCWPMSGTVPLPDAYNRQAWMNHTGYSAAIPTSKLWRFARFILVAGQCTDGKSWTCNDDTILPRSHRPHGLHPADRRDGPHSGGLRVG